jgi:hypothetical protein
MSLTNDDLDKIQAVVSAGVELTKAYVDRRISQSESKMELVIHETVRQSESRLTTKIDEVKTMHHEDHVALAEDVEELQKLPIIAKSLEASQA